MSDLPSIPPLVQKMDETRRAYREAHWELGRRRREYLSYGRAQRSRGGGWSPSGDPEWERLYGAWKQQRAETARLSKAASLAKLFAFEDPESFAFIERRTLAQLEDPEFKALVDRVRSEGAGQVVRRE